MERTILFEDKSFEEITRREINEAHEALQAVLNAWDSLKLSSINSVSELYDLTISPEQMYKEAVMTLTRKNSDVNLPVPPQRPVSPEPFYAAVRQARTFPFSAREYGLFSVSKGKVKLVDEQVNLYVTARTLYGDSESQVAFYEDYQAMLRVFNRINQLTNGSLTASLMYREAWSKLMNLPPEQFDSYPAMEKIELLREYLPMA